MYIKMLRIYEDFDEKYNTELVFLINKEHQQHQRLINTIERELFKVPYKEEEDFYHFMQQAFSNSAKVLSAEQLENYH